MDVSGHSEFQALWSQENCFSVRELSIVDFANALPMSWGSARASHLQECGLG